MVRPTLFFLSLWVLVGCQPKFDPDTEASDNSIVVDQASDEISDDDTSDYDESKKADSNGEASLDSLKAAIKEGPSGLNRAVTISVSAGADKIPAGARLDFFNASNCQGSPTLSRTLSSELSSLETSITLDAPELNKKYVFSAQISFPGATNPSCLNDNLEFTFTQSFPMDISLLGFETDILSRPQVTLTFGENPGENGTLTFYDQSECQGTQLGQVVSFHESALSQDLDWPSDLSDPNRDMYLSIGFLAPSGALKACSNSVLYRFLDKGCDATALASATIVVGDGGPDRPYTICNVDQLQTVNDDLDAFYQLGANIDASDTVNWTAGGTGTGFIPLGSCGTDYDCYTYFGAGGLQAFTGSFDGNGFTISGLFIDRSRPTVGLFGMTSMSSVVTNVHLKDIQITSQAPPAGIHNVGGIIGRFSGFVSEVSSVGGSVTGGSNTGGILGLDYYGISHSLSNSAAVSGVNYVGGIKGNNNYGYTRNLSNSGDVTGANSVGGIIGYHGGPTIHYLNNTGDVTLTGYNGGGVIGYLSWGYLLRSSNSGAVESTYDGESKVGGVVGFSGSSGTVVDSWSSGDVTGFDQVGGLIGRQNDRNSAFYPGARIQRSWSSSKVSGRNQVGGLAGHIYNSNATPNDPIIESSLVTGEIQATGTPVFGLSGTLPAVSEVINGHWFDASNSDAASACLPGGASGCTTSASINTFYDPNASLYTASSPWDFLGISSDGTREIWRQPSEALPQLAQIPPEVTDFSGLGTKDQPFLIGTVAEWNAISNNLEYMHSYFKLTANLDFSGETFVPLASTTDWDDSFRGEIDGDGFQLQNITYTDSSGETFAGIVGHGKGARFRNLMVDNATVTTNSRRGGVLVGYCSHCYFYQVAIEDSTLNYSGSGLNSAGGSLVGLFWKGLIVNTYVHNVAINSTHASDARAVGGVSGELDTVKVGNVYGSGTINYVYVNKVGGLTASAVNYPGFERSGNDFAWSRFFVDFTINGNTLGSSSGGISAEDDGYNLNGAYWVDRTDGVNFCLDGNTNTDCNLVGTPTDLQSSTHPVYSSDPRSWDFDKVWRERAGDYPTLRVFDK